MANDESAAIVFTPTSGTLTFDRSEPSMNIFIEFAESMDPEDPRPSQEYANALLEDLYIPYRQWTDLAGKTMRNLVVDDFTECSIGYYDFFNPIDLEYISFGQFTADAIRARLKGIIDFTFEGLGRFGKVNFDWEVELQVTEANDT